MSSLLPSRVVSPLLIKFWLNCFFAVRCDSWMIQSSYETGDMYDHLLSCIYNNPTVGEIFLNIWIIWVLVEPNIFRINQSKLLLSSNVQDSNPSKNDSFLLEVIRNSTSWPRYSDLHWNSNRSHGQETGQRGYLGAATFRAVGALRWGKFSNKTRKCSRLHLPFLP